MPGTDLSSLRALINCSEPVQARSIDEFMAAYGSSGLKHTVVQSSYAMAENVFAVTQSAIEAAPHRIDVDRLQLSRNRVAVPVAPDAAGSISLVSSGRCLAGQQVRIVDANGTDLRDGEVGEIAVHSDCLFDGYYIGRT